MDHLTHQVIHRAPSVGGIVKKIMAANPDLGAEEIICLIRQATRKQGEEAGEYASAEIVDEKRALELAKATLIVRDRK